MNKTAESDAVFSKVLFLVVFQEIKSEKNTTSIFMEKKDFVQKMDTRKRSRAKIVGPTRPDSLAAWAHLSGASSTASPSAFAYPLIYMKKWLT